MHHAIPPLRKRKKDGQPYTRPAKIEALIARTLDLPFDDFGEWAGITDRRHPGYLPSEVLVHRIRATHQNNSDDQFNVLYRLLSDRVLRSCPSADTRIGDKEAEIAKIADVREYVLERFVRLILIDRQFYSEKLDIFEARFDRAVKLLRFDAFRRASRRHDRVTPLEYDESGDIPDDVEKSLAGLQPESMSLEEEITYRFQIRRAIDSLPKEERRVLDMLEADIPIESDDPGTPSISRLLDCTPKTVRNRRARAIKRVRQQLGLETCHDG